MGDIYWERDVKAPAVTTRRVTASLCARLHLLRCDAYAGNKSEDDTFWVTFKGLWLQLIISADHIVYGITIIAPQ